MCCCRRHLHGAVESWACDLQCFPSPTHTSPHPLTHPLTHSHIPSPTHTFPHPLTQYSVSKSDTCHLSPALKSVNAPPMSRGIHSCLLVTPLALPTTHLISTFLDSTTPAQGAHSPPVWPYFLPLYPLIEGQQW